MSGIRNLAACLAAIMVTTACGATGDSADTEEPEAVAEAAPAAEAAGAAQIACVPQRESVEGRASPYDSVQVAIGGQTAQVCYGRPYTNGREIFGGLVPYDTLWRTGANEPTIIHTPVAATIAGIAVQPGSYSIYTVPGREQWTIIVNRSITQWGHEGSYSPEVRAQEVGRATVPAQTLEEPIEQFTIGSEAAGNGSNLIIEWERTRVSVPIMPG
jgi:hypothetical protein